MSGRADLTVRYRRGYVNESSDPEEQFRTALWSPIDSSAIALTAEIGETFEVKLVKVKLGIGVAGLELKPHGDREQGKIHVIFAQNDGDGRPFDYRDDTVQLDLKPGTEIVAYRQQVRPIPKHPSSV